MRGFAETIILLCILSCGVFVSAANSQKLSPNEIIENAFAEHNISGSFVLKKIGHDEFIVFNQVRSQKRFIPASTFKIANSLIALETGVVSDIDEVIPYGGKPQPFKAWERDMSMRGAIKISNVPVYQELARRVGLERYGKWLEKLNYGNQQTGTKTETFWLEGPLTISASEQVEFIERLIEKDLPLSMENQSAVIDILRLETNKGKILFGKTGWTRTPDPDLGWFVGWVTDGTDQTVFALNMDIKNSADSRKRIILPKQILGELGLY